MGAVSALTVTEKRSAQADVAVKANAIYTRTVKFTLLNGETAGAANLTGLIIPKDTLILGGSFQTSVAQGGTATFKFGVATDGDFSTAHAYNSTTKTALKTPIPLVTTDDRQVVYTTASAAVTAAECELTLLLCAVGTDPATYGTFTN